MRAQAISSHTLDNLSLQFLHISTGGEPLLQAAASRLLIIIIVLSTGYSLS